MAKKLSRSGAGNFLGIAFLCVIAVLMVLPMVYAVGNSFKPMDELFKFPPTILPRRWVTTNYTDLFVLMGNSWVPFSRYFFNTIFITSVGTFGQIVCCSLCAYPLAMYNFPGRKMISGMIVTALMFNGTVLWLPLFMIKAGLGMIDTYWAIIIPTFGSSMGMYLMQQFMSQIPKSLVEAARIDGAGSFKIFWTIVLPQVKSAWLTLMIFSVQGLWNTGASVFIQSESLKTLPYALSQIVSTGIARQGVANAISVIMMAVPITTFIISQSNIIETMATSGMKD
ncbi:MAG: carbohydrate ABC transporter permease [Clostridia bacterium]|nr:carbohydrate ABC transporter permease [Clostridia bacterium]